MRLLIWWALACSMVLSAMGAGSFTEISAKAEAAREESRLMEAISLYREALELNPDWTDGWWSLGTILYELDRYGEAIPPFEKVLVDRPESAEAAALLGLCNYEEGDYPRALLSLNEAVSRGITAIAPLGYPVLYRQALLLARAGQFELSSRILQDLSGQGHYDKAAIREAMGISSLRLPLLPEELPVELRLPVLLAGRAMGYIATSEETAAGFALEELERRFPEVPNVHFLRGNFLAQTTPEEALSAYLRELEREPDHVLANLEVAGEYLARGEAESALPFARKAVDVAAGSFAARAILGRVYLEAGRVDEAIVHLERGRELAPDSPELHFYLGQAYRKAGRIEAADESFMEFERLRKLREERKAGRTP